MPSNSVSLRISAIEKNDCHRERYLIDDRAGKFIHIQQKQLINFCSNDYLGLSMHPEVIAASIQGIRDYGTGSTSSAQVSGYLKPHLMLEEAFADYLHCDAALLFPSGYHANLGVLSTFANRHSVVIADKLCHASLIDGITLSRAKHARYAHQDDQQAETLLKKYADKDKILLTERVFSMEGNITDCKKLSTLTANYSAKFMIDDAHGVGILDHAPLTQNDFSCLIAPLGKAFGSQGAIVAGKHETIEPLLQLARTYRYTTAIAPAAACAALAALRIIQRDNERREKLQSLILYFIHAAKERGLNLISSDLTPIKSILIGDNKKTMQLQKKLLSLGFFISCIRPPTVPVGSARIRITLNVAHTENDITQLLDHLAENIHD